MNKKFMDFEVKEADGEARTYWFTGSTDDRDRMGDVIVQSGWKLQNFKKNPVILWAHKYSDLPIGKAVETKVDDGRLRLKIEFAPESVYPFAAQVERLVAAKFLRTGSVGFAVWKDEPLTEEDKKKRPEMTFGRRLHGELLEFSIVPVPANPMALGDKAFGELVSRSFANPDALPEKKSALLPYEKDGKVDMRLLKASIAALSGARGQVIIPADERHLHKNHLMRIWRENGGDNAIEVKDGVSQEDLRKEFADVWHEELLDVIQLGLEESDRQILPLIKGQTRESIKLTRDLLSKILEASEEKPEVEKPQDGISAETIDALKGLNDNLAAVNAALR